MVELLYLTSEEKWLHQTFRNNKLRAKVRTKLVFYDRDHGSGPHTKLNLDSTADSLSKMIIDDTPLINSTTDFCKRKEGDISVASRNVDKQVSHLLVLSFRAAQERNKLPKRPHPQSWSPPGTGLFKLNFDGGALVNPAGGMALSFATTCAMWP
ncbi:hypothetical protein Cgig2_007150 [Carnegiea gigantea]|uniref:Uncharacterized protein n=1 Tax=Carnegiea gigantea TaxID=171969 RepID=A0A9Q1KMS5_9CARY|nr:hypothetical protein Cgig2_007150 [Carnegiea gigantea]